MSSIESQAVSKLVNIEGKGMNIEDQQGTPRQRASQVMMQEMDQIADNINEK